MIGFIDTAQVYTPAPAGGDFTVLATTLTMCRLVVTNSTVVIGTGRAELRTAPRLLWADDYAMPGSAQIAVAGVRYNVKAGTHNAVRGPGGTVLYHRCEVEKIGA